MTDKMPLGRQLAMRRRSRDLHKQAASKEIPDGSSRRFAGRRKKD